MSVRDVTDLQVWVSPTGAAGTYALIQDLQSFEGTHGAEDEVRVRVFGNANPYVRTGDDTDDYSLSGLYNPDDTNGQNVLRNAKDAGSSAWLAFIYEGAGAVEKGYTQECKITEYAESGESDGDFVQVSFTAVGAGTRSPIPGGGLP